MTYRRRFISRVFSTFFVPKGSNEQISAKGRFSHQTNMVFSFYYLEFYNSHKIFFIDLIFIITYIIKLIKYIFMNY